MDWGDWAGPEPVAAAAPQPAQQQAPRLQNTGLVRAPLDAQLFAAAEDEFDEFGGFEAAPAALPAQRGDQQAQAAQQQRLGQQALAKGDAVWLLDGRSGSWVAATVVSIDRTVSPPSYGVELLSDGGTYRETEEHRLRPRRPGEAPPPAAAATGHRSPNPWAAAPASPFEQPAGGPGKAAAAAAGTLHHPVQAAAQVAPAAPAAASEEDDFGDWAAAGAAPAPAASPPPPAGRAAGSAWVQGTTHAAPSSAHGSPQRLPSRRSSAASSPVLDRFRSFLHAAAPQVSEQLELEEAAEEQRAAVQQQRHDAYGSLQQFAAAHLPPSPRGGVTAAGVPSAVPAAAPAAAAAAVTPGASPAAAAAAANGWDEDDFGSFEVAEPPPPQQQAAPPPMAVQQQEQQPPPQQQQEQQQQPGAATPRGVQRDAPLPLDLFGCEPAEDGAANGAEPAPQLAPQPAWAALGGQAAAAAAAAALPNIAAAAAAQPQPPAAAGAPDAAAAADGGGWEDDFADFVSSPLAAVAEAAPGGVQQPAAAVEAAAEQGGVGTQPAAAAGQPPAQKAQVAAVTLANGSLEGAAAADWLDAPEALATAGAESAKQPADAPADAFAAAAPAPPPPLPLPQQQPVSPSSTGSAGSRQSALLAALHPVSSAGSSARSSFEQPRAAPAAAPLQQWGGLPPAAPLAAAALLANGAVAGPAIAAGPAAAAVRPAGAWPAVGQELVQEYAVAWARLLEAAAPQLQASAALWAEAGSRGCWHELQQLPTAQQHLAACAQLYHVAAVVRLAAQQLGLFSLVVELQEAWAQVEAAWLSPPPSPEGSGCADEPAKQQPAAEQRQQPALRDAALVAWEAACAAGIGSPAMVQGFLQTAAVRLEALSLDAFPRMLAWSEGLCGLTLLPLSLFEGVLPVAAWEELGGRPCLVPLANLWLHHVSSLAPQLD